jgi:hypothetical protein
MIGISSKLIVCENKPSVIRTENTSFRVSVRSQKTSSVFP